MCRGELSAVIARLMSKRLWSGWKWLWGVTEIPSPLPCSPVIREWLWKKAPIEKKKLYESPRRYYRWKVLNNYFPFPSFPCFSVWKTFFFTVKNNSFYTSWKWHCVKSVRIWSYSGMYFPGFRKIEFSGRIERDQWHEIG